MADNLIFPIGFDLEKAVKEAGDKWDSKYADALEKRIQKRAINVRLQLDVKSITDLTAKVSGISGLSPKVTPKIDTSSFEGALKSLQASLQAVDYESLTEDEASAITTLTKAVNSLARAYAEKNKAAALEDRTTQELKAATAAEKRAKAELATAKAIEQRGKKEANVAIAKANQTKAEENAAAAAARRAKAEEARIAALNRRKKSENDLAASAARMEKAQLSLANAQNKAANATRNANREFRNQDGYISRLIKRLAVYAGFQQIMGFLRNVREVTAEFELQRVSLGAIIQDQTRANALFSEIKQFALKSPVSILDLTKYTKQLAAYKIGVDELFETTKKLTDVSVGLGVSLDRVILAYGQVRARGALYSSEIRQFTEMGVPIVEELAAKLSKANGELVTSAQVLKLVEKGAISFELVKEVFDDMTSAGGMFYNMQEKQGNTLYGMWAKLGDAASVMYDEIGNTDSVKEGMKAGIEALTDLMRNWERTARAMGAIGLVIAGLVVKKKILALEIAKVDAIQRTYNARMVKANALASSNSRLVRAQGVAMGVYATTMRTAATVAAAFGTSLRAIRAALVTTGWGALIVALGYLVDKLFITKTAADEVKEALDKVYGETAMEQGKSTRNFEYLAKLATDASKGYKERKNALEELQRTYKDILPAEVLEIEYLTKLKGNYDSLTNSIRAYVAEQQRRKAIDEISSAYGVEKQKYEKPLTDFFREEGWSEQEIARFWDHFYKIAADESKSLEQVVFEAAEKGGRDGFATVQKLLQHQDWMGQVDKAVSNKIGLSLFGPWLGGGIDSIDLLRDVVLQENQDLEQNEERMKAAASAASRFADAYAKSAERIANTNLFHASGERIDRDSYLGEQMLKNKEVKELANILKAEFEKVGIEWGKGFDNLIRKVNEGKPELISALDFTAILDSLTEKLKDPKLTDAQREMITNLISFAREAQQKYREIIPQDPVVRTWQQRFRQIAQAVGGFRREYNQYLMKAGEDLEAYNKRLKDSLEGLKNNVKGLLATQKLVVKAGIFAKLLYGVSAEELQAKIDEANNEIKVIEKALAEQPNFESGGSKSDPRLQNLKEEISLVQKLYNEYKQLEKQEGASKAAADMRKMAGATIDMFKNKYGFDLPTDAKDLTSALEILYAKMESLPKKTFAQLDKELKEFRWTIGKVNIDESQKNIEAELKKLADKISRTKAAKEFYEKILSQTGNYDLAARLSISIYGEDGKALKKQIIENIQATLGKTKEGVDIDFTSAIRADSTINYDELMRVADAQLKLGNISEETYNKIAKMRDEDRKDLAKTVEGWLKATEKAKTYGDKLADVYRTTATEIGRIQTAMKNGDIGRADGTELIAGYRRKEAEEVAKLQYEAFKDSPLYVQMFDDLDNASTKMLTNMKVRLQAMQGQWKNLDPTQLKELQSRLNEIDSQLAKRNPFKTLADSIRKYRELRTGGDARGNKSRDAADNDVLKWTAAYEEAEKTLAKVKADKGASELEIEGATQIVNLTKREKEEAERVAANWKKVEDAIGLSANELFSMLNWAGDIASGIASISEAMGADEEDVQYWNDIASALGDISGGIQDIVKSAMDGNVIGIISSTLTAVPKMFVGFTNLFSAGKVRKANKEIKRQQELLNDLEHTYSRLEKAAGKVFGLDYINNFKQQQKNLEAQAKAYKAMAAAERSKGKKADDAKIQEYENAYRETMDEIADMQGQIAAQMLGTDLTSAARDFARAWLDAYKEFGNTADAMSKKFHEMIENMVVESMLARVMERALKPMFDLIDNMKDQDFYSESFWKQVVAKAEQGAKNADAGARTMMSFLEQAGISVRGLGGELTGITREIAGASEETMSGVAAALNTQNYYASHVPVISEHVAAIRMLLEGGEAQPRQGGVDTTALWNQHLELQQGIYRHTAETVAQCERIASQCESIASDLRRVIGSVPSEGSGLRVWINGR